MISEGSCDTEDWSNGCFQNSYKTPGPTVVDVEMQYSFYNDKITGHECFQLFLKQSAKWPWAKLLYYATMLKRFDVKHEIFIFFITGINYILKYIKIENKQKKLLKTVIIFQNITVFTFDNK